LGPSPVVFKPFQDDERVIEPIDILVDVIIGFLEKGTAYMRAVGNRSFSLLSDAVKDSTINLILSVRLVWWSLPVSLIWLTAIGTPGPFEPCDRF